MPINIAQTNLLKLLSGGQLSFGNPPQVHLRAAPGLNGGLEFQLHPATNPPVNPSPELLQVIRDVMAEMMGTARVAVPGAINWTERRGVIVNELAGSPPGVIHQWLDNIAADRSNPIGGEVQAQIAAARGRIPVRQPVQPNDLQFQLGLLAGNTLTFNSVVLSAAFNERGHLIFKIIPAPGQPPQQADLQQAHAFVSNLSGAMGVPVAPDAPWQGNHNEYTLPVPNLDQNHVAQWLTNVESTPNQDPAIRNQVNEARNRARILNGPRRDVPPPEGGVAPIIPNQPQRGGVHVNGVDLFGQETLTTLQQFVEDTARAANGAPQWRWEPRNANTLNEEVDVVFGPAAHEKLTLKKSTNQIVAQDPRACAKIADMLEPLKRAPTYAMGVAVFHDNNDRAFLTELTKQMLDKGFAVKIELKGPPAPQINDDAILAALPAGNIPNSNPQETYRARFDRLAHDIPEPARRATFNP